MRVTSRGVVREYHPDQGWGVIEAPDTPGGCWVHFSALGGRPLASGQPVSFRAEQVNQDGYAYRAVKAWTGDVEPDDVAPETGSSVTFHTDLVLGEQ